MSEPMVLAILDGRKTVTRRVVKPQPEWHEVDQGGECFGFKHREASRYVVNSVAPPCPYGQRGAYLWVRETWSSADDPVHSRNIVYRADGERAVRWRPSIHMPRWASRLTLRITGVRIERLQEISETDAEAEGAVFHDGYGIGNSGWRHDFKAVHVDAKSSYARLWDEINGKGSWDANPFVWVIEFERVEQQARTP